MRVDLSGPTPLAYFAALVQRDEGLPLLEAAACLAQDADPGLDVQQVLDEVDRLAGRLQRQVARGAGVIERLRGLNRFFFEELGFGGNLNDYHHPDNSYLHRVLHTRRGIPISLAVLWLELAQGLGLAAQGVGFPGHFLMQVELPEGLVVLDPFTGQSLSLVELRARLDEWQPQPQQALPLAMHLRPASRRQILARMLRNLQQIHRTQRDWTRLVQVQDRLVTLLPEAWDEYRERGLALAELGQTERAQADLSLYLQRARDARDRAQVAERLDALPRSRP